MSEANSDTPTLAALNGGLAVHTENKPVRLNTEDLTSKEKLKKLHRELRKATGDDEYDPVIELALLAKEAQADGDRKTAVTALNSVADRLYPKLKAYEIDERNDIPLVIDNGPQQANSGAAEKPAAGDKRFPFE